MRLLRHKGIWIIAAALSLSLILAALAYFGQGRVGLLGDVSNAILAPMQRAASAVSRNVSHIYGEAARYEALLLENEALQMKLAEGERAAREGTLAAQENARLHALLDFKATRSALTLHPAKVQSESAQNWSRSLRLDTGSDAGLAVGDCVLDEYGNLVGRISQIGAHFSVVQLLTDASFTLGAQSLDSAERAVLGGDISLMPEGLARLSYLPRASQLAVGEEILTQANEGQYPDGLRLGSVEQVSLDEGGLSSYALLRPAAKLDALRQVFIVTDFS